MRLEKTWEVKCVNGFTFTQSGINRAEAIRRAVRITNDKQAKYDDVSYRIDTFTYKGMK